MKWLMAAILLMTLAPVAIGNDAHGDGRIPNDPSPSGYQWHAHHESGDFSEYFWRHPDTACGWLMVNR